MDKRQKTQDGKGIERQFQPCGTRVLPKTESKTVRAYQEKANHSLSFLGSISHVSHALRREAKIQDLLMPPSDGDDDDGDGPLTIKIF